MIEIFDLSPAQFELSEKRSKRKPNGIATQIKYKHSNFYFLIDTNVSKAPVVEFSPADSTIRESFVVKDWSRVEYNFTLWLNYLVREVSVDDKWARFNQEIAGIDINPEGDDSRFNVHEFEIVAKNIDLIKTKISELNLLPDQMEQFNKKLDHLKEMAKDLNKIDWKNLFVGGIVSLTIAMSVTPETATKIWSIVKEVFGTYLLR